MTYGETTRQLREDLATLLGQHRIIQRLGGPGSHLSTPWSTETERARMGQIIGRYRVATLTWCLEAVIAASPRLEHTRPTSTRRGPASELRHRLTQAVETAGSGERLADLLEIRHGNPVMDTWQRLAKTAVVGERDFTAGVNSTILTPEQANTVLKDAADLTRALVILDLRYKNIPGWRHLTHQTRLDQAADGVSRLVTGQSCDVSVDNRGWRPPLGLMEGPPLPGTTGAVQAQHNLVVHLAQLPNALNLRRVLLSQTELSHYAARVATLAAPDLAPRFADRAQVYTQLVRDTRNLGGLIGGGVQAAIESQNASTRLRRTTDHSQPVASLRELATLCRRTDARVANILEHGVSERIYLVNSSSDHLSPTPNRGVQNPATRWTPMERSEQRQIVDLVLNRLRPVFFPATDISVPTAQRRTDEFGAHPSRNAGRRK